jgi:iron complex outermembrane receptor protein
MQIAEMKPRYLPFLISLTLLTWAPAAIASEDNPTGANPTGATDAFDLSIEDLMQVVVTSVSRKSQTLAQTAAAAYVIQADDIRRSGATNIPEALRLAPGVQVSALGNNKWAVSIRGQADRFSNKLLVLVDGRSVYSPIFSGVLWEALDVPLENIARIEVMRGPGASVWGANAVNGVINIITHSAFDHRGGQVAIAAGSELRGYGMARYGWNPDPDTAVQLHVKAHDYEASQFSTGGPGADDWQNQGAGFKLERLLERGTLQVQGGVTRSRADDEVIMYSAPPAVTPTRATQAIDTTHLMARWEDQDQAGQGRSFQAYLEHQDYDHVILSEHRINLDMEYQQRHSLAGKHDLIWGIGYRRISDEIENSPLIQMSEAERSTNLYSAYLQDEITLVPERWRLSLGARLERNDYTGTALQPNLRLLWTPNQQNSGWLSLARAIRTPSRIERGGTINVQVLPASPPTPPTLVQFVLNELDDEQLDALDLGWRLQINPSTSLDLAAFAYRYDQLRGAAMTTPQIIAGPYVLVQVPENNANSADAHGLEISLDWRPRPDWRLQANYSWIDLDIKTASLVGQTQSGYTGTTPSQQFSLRSSLDITPTLQGDAWLRHVSRIDNSQVAIPAFTTLDLRLSWQASKKLEVSLVGQNLLDSAHPEYGSGFVRSTPSEVQRGFYVKADWKL